MLKRLFVFAVCGALLPTAQAGNVFQVDLTLTSGPNAGQSGSVGTNTAPKAFDLLDTSGLQTVLSNYTGVESANGKLDYRGLPVLIAFPTQNSPILTMDIPQLGINKSFNGATRSESRDMLKDYFKNGDLLGQIFKQLAEVSPVDPIAGNPNSVMSQMVANDFSLGFDDPTGASGAVNNATTGQQASNNLVGIGMRFGSFRQGDLSSQVLTLPLSYTVRSDLDPRRQLIFSMPLTQGSVEGAKTYNAGLGVAYRLPINDDWTLTPSGNYAVTGSRDLGSAAPVVSAAITSNYTFDLEKYAIAIGNMVGYYKTLQAKIDNVSYDPDIQNTVFRNGVMLSLPTTLFGKRMSSEYSLIDTRFTGTALYMESYQEIGITLGTSRSATSAREYLRGGLNYLSSSKSKGYTAHIGYWF